MHSGTLPRLRPTLSSTPSSKLPTPSPLSPRVPNSPSAASFVHASMASPSQTCAGKRPLDAPGSQPDEKENAFESRKSVGHTCPPSGHSLEAASVDTDECLPCAPCVHSCSGAAAATSPSGSSPESAAKKGCVAEEVGASARRTADSVLTIVPLRSSSPVQLPVRLPIYLPFRSTEKVVIAIDNDECIGSWADLSMLFTLYVQVLKTPPPVDLFVRLLTDTVCARPGLKVLYDTVLGLKSTGHVHSIYMCTAARDSLGWVSFLKTVLERWYGRQVYDGVVEGNMIQEWHGSRGTPVSDPANGCYVKDMNQIRALANVPLDSHVIMLDDHPENIRNGHAIHVHPYFVAVNLVEVARVFVTEWNHALEATYGRTMQANWMNYRVDPSRFTVAWKDTVMESGAASVSNLVSQLLSKPQ